MDYSFDTLKTLYDKYDIEKDSETKQTVIVDRKTRDMFSLEGDFGFCVKFAHTWVFATRYNKNLSTSGISKSTPTEDEYGRAFNESSRKIYNAIMANVVTNMQESGKMLKSEALIEELKSDIKDTKVEHIVKGLFAKKAGFSSFFYWSLKIAGREDILLDKTQDQEKEAHTLAA